MNYYIVLSKKVTLVTLLVFALNMLIYQAFHGIWGDTF